MMASGNVGCFLCTPPPPRLPAPSEFSGSAPEKVEERCVTSDDPNNGCEGDY